ncbi:MAG TPA: IS1634 family transposase [Peptococcaceae bacterium]|nr:IS1634 family transposase [Peptococcaceae bacterium]
MYVRTKVFKNKDGTTRTYLYIVEGKRVNGKVRQEIVANLGRLETLKEGKLDKLIEGLAKYSQKQWVQAQARSIDPKWAKELGPVLIFRRLWEDLQLDSILKKLLAGTQMAIDVEEAVFAMVLNRLSNPRSKLGITKWKETVYRPQFEQLELHHFYRSLDFLAENKGEIEVQLFERVKNLFNLELDLVFWDTTSTYFEGKGAENLAEYGFSKDHRPDRLQVIIGILMTRDGIPVAHQVFPGSTADVETFRAALVDLQRRFKIRKVILVVDRGMVSKKVLEEIAAAGFNYIVGVRMRKLKSMKDILSRAGRYHQVKDNLKVKEVLHEGNRYIICYNPEEAERERLAREEMVQKLEQKLKMNGFKSLIGNKGYRRYLKVSGSVVTIDRDALKAEARYDGKYVLQTNTDLTPEEVALAYKGLWQVERTFRELKSGLELRPIYHWNEQRIRGHIMVCFLAFVLEVALHKRLKEAGCEEPYQNLMIDLEQLKAVEITVDGKTYLARTDLQGKAYDVFKAVGLRPPSKVLEVMPSS